VLKIKKGRISSPPKFQNQSINDFKIVVSNFKTRINNSKAFKTLSILASKRQTFIGLGALGLIESINML
jgi:hypothetical protein